MVEIEDLIVLLKHRRPLAILLAEIYLWEHPDAPDWVSALAHLTSIDYVDEIETLMEVEDD